MYIGKMMHQILEDPQVPPRRHIVSPQHHVHMLRVETAAPSSPPTSSTSSHGQYTSTPASSIAATGGTAAAIDMAVVGVHVGGRVSVEKPGGVLSIGQGNGLLDPVLGFESCVAFIYMSLGDVRLRYFQEPKLGFVVEKNETQFMVIMTSNVEGDGREPINEQAVANQYGAMRADMNQIYSKITELEMEASEHSLVIGAIQPLDPSRRCYRMIGGVLVERTIKEVLPAVQRNKEGLEEVISRLNEALEKKKKEIAEFEAKYKIRIRKSDSEGKDDGDRKEGSAQGVLVGPASATE
ncbi:hypothetical protein HHK36_022705 [Tetracentron sinense]|uniref:Prefoldin subunit 2 n=1 Tax=Tetracentron sinense TaxID=13715 RepID=A0A834YTR5_TETSI|nr:hypothetical protein HHK36_022705 [Tetracentron sinense]